MLLIQINQKIIQSQKIIRFHFENAEPDTLTISELELSENRFPGTVLILTNQYLLIRGVLLEKFPPSCRFYHILIASELGSLKNGNQNHFPIVETELWGPTKRPASERQWFFYCHSGGCRDNFANLLNGKNQLYICQLTEETNKWRL